MQTANRHHANRPSIATRSQRARMAASYAKPAFDGAIIAQIVTLAVIGLLMAYLAGFALGTAQYGGAIVPLLFVGGVIHAVFSLVRER